MAKKAPARKLPIPVLPPLKFSNSLTEILNKPIPWIIEDLISEGEQMLIFGAPKVGKSQFALQMAIAVALGNRFHHWPAPDEETKKKVLYVNLEIGERSFMRRIVDHVIAETTGNEGWARPDPKATIPENKVEEINDLIAGRLFFSTDMRSLKMTKDIIDQVLAASQKKDGEVQPHGFVNQWHTCLDELKPDLIIFDTLSKIHSIDERENNAIQGVLSLIRTIATVKKEDDPAKRRELAHVIVHHSRKNSEGSKGGGDPSLDSIRGGSSIRAEADVIVGIFPGKEDSIGGGNVMSRDVVIEARNIEGGKARFRFDGIRFRLTTEADAKESEEAHIAKILDIFKGAAVRGISTGVLAVKFGGDENPNSSDYKASAKFLSKFAKEGKHLELIHKSSDKNLISTAPVFGGRNAASFYWIRDGSDWLKTDSIQNAMADMEARNPGTGSDGGGPTSNRIIPKKRPRKKKPGKTATKRARKQQQSPSI